jgi:hypothetical protein
MSELTTNITALQKGVRVFRIKDAYSAALLKLSV